MKKYYLLDAINFICSFLVCRWLFMTFLFYSFSSIFMTIDIWPSLLAVMCMTIPLFTLCQICYRPNISKYLVIINYIIYFLITIYLLFFKSIGISGINLHLLDYFIVDMREHPAIVCFNLLFFLPLGFLFRPTWKHQVLFLIFIICTESIQLILLSDFLI